MEVNNGERLDRKRVRLSLEGRHVSKFDLRRAMNDWYRTYDRKTVTELHHINDPSATLQVMYDYKVDRLSARWIKCSVPINKFAFLGSCGSVTPHIIYRWVHQLRGIGVYNAATGKATVHPYQFHTGEVNARSLLANLPPPSRPMDSKDIMRFSLQPFGDREVFGVASEDGMQLWFFNPDFVPELEDAEPFLAIEESG